MVSRVYRYRGRIVMAFSRSSKKSVEQLCGRAGDEAKAVSRAHSLEHLVPLLWNLPLLRPMMGCAWGTQWPTLCFWMTRFKLVT